MCLNGAARSRQRRLQRITIHAGYYCNFKTTVRHTSGAFDPRFIARYRLLENAGRCVAEYEMWTLYG